MTADMRGALRRGLYAARSISTASSDVPSIATTTVPAKIASGGAFPRCANKSPEVKYAR